MYKQALEVYQGHGWTLAEVYIRHVVGHHQRYTQHAAALHSMLRDMVSFSYHLLLGVGSGNETSTVGVHLLFVSMACM